MGLTIAKATRPTRDKKEETAARIVDGGLLGRTLKEDFTYTRRRVCRKEEIVYDEYLIVRDVCARHVVST
jgi:hypothetical protein